MAPKITSSSNRNKRSTKKSVTGAKPSNRANRQSTSTAQVPQGGSRAGGRSPGGVRVTNASQRTSGSARVTGSARPALPPGRQGGSLATQGNAKPENPRRTNARNRQATAGRGTTGPGRVGQPAGSANRIYGANRVNQAVNRAVTQNTVRQGMRAGTGAAIVGALLNAPEELKKLQALLRNPKGALSRASSDILSGKAYNPETVKTAKPAKPTFNEKAYASQQKFAVPKPPAKPKPPAATTPTRASAPSRSSTPSRSSAPASRPAASAPARTPSRPAASRPSTPKPSSASSASKVAGTSGIGPVKSGEEYARTKGSLREQARRLREMQAESRKRQGK